MKTKPYYKYSNFSLYHGNSLDILAEIPENSVDMVFADPPYFLSNNGLSIQSGKIVSVNKGNWDKSEGFEFINNFNRKWLTLVRDKMKDNATIWISGTMHNIFSIGQILTELDFKILNVITWEKNKDTYLDYGYEASKYTLWSLSILSLVVTCAFFTAWYLKKGKILRSD